MKKIFLGLVFALFAVPFAAGAATVTITTAGSSGTGSIANASGAGSATASHTGIVGEFDDFWSVTLDPSSATFNIGTSNPTFVDFDVQYNTGSGWVDFSPLVYFEGVVETLVTSVDGVSSFDIHVFGETNSQSSYNLTVQAVPLPAAVWLFGSALMGLVGISRRKSTALAA